MVKSKDLKHMRSCGADDADVRRDIECFRLRSNICAGIRLGLCIDPCLSEWLGEPLGTTFVRSVEDSPCRAIVELLHNASPGNFHHPEIQVPVS